MADAYAFFIRERFGDRLTWVREVDDSLLDAALPLLTLQPVLENAVEHGIAPAGGGEIDPDPAGGGQHAHRDRQHRRAPDPPEDRARMDAALAGDQDAGHVGLSNIASRLRLIYQDRAGGSAPTEEDRTVIRMRIPILTAKRRERRNDQIPRAPQSGGYQALREGLALLALLLGCLSAFSPALADPVILRTASSFAGEDASAVVYSGLLEVL